MVNITLHSVLRVWYSGDHGKGREEERERERERGGGERERKRGRKRKRKRERCGEIYVYIERKSSGGLKLTPHITIMIIVEEAQHTVKSRIKAGFAYKHIADRSLKIKRVNAYKPVARRSLASMQARIG